MLVLAGISLVTTFSYNTYEKTTMDLKLDQVEKDQADIISHFNAYSGHQDKINRLGYDTILKMENVMIKNYDTLRKDICSTQSSFNYQLLRYIIQESYDQLKVDIQSSMRGRVSEFILSYKHLNILLDKNPLFENSVFHRDPASFYLLSEASLVATDIENNIIYFFIKTPIISAYQLTPVYKVESLGWIENNRSLKLQLPETVMLTSGMNNNYQNIINVDQNRCTLKSNVWSCIHPTETLSKPTLCLNSLLFYNSTKNCKISSPLISKKEKIKVNMVRSGIIVLGKTKVSIGKKSEGDIYHTDLVKTSKIKTTLFQYESFETLSIEGKLYKSLSMPFVVEELSPIVGFWFDRRTQLGYNERIETSAVLEEHLFNLNQTVHDTVADKLRQYATHKEEQTTLNTVVWFLLSLLFIISIVSSAGVFILYNLYTKKEKTSQEALLLLTA
ncbi:MAG: hypothetical protein ACRYE7_00245, partial [Janthinobacterium lividum]